MFLYKLNEKEETNREAKKVTKAYHNQTFDAKNADTKYERRV